MKRSRPQYGNACYHFFISAATSLKKARFSRAFFMVRVFITDSTLVKAKSEVPRETSDLERKNNTIGRPDAACGGW